MITKKLAVPLINEKILQQAVHCYIATAAISNAGFDLIRSRIPTNCKIDLVTGLDELSSPEVLQRIYRNYQGRINLNIYTRNVLHANVFIFDLPYRKSIAFVGSGNFSLEGLKDNEELFWKISDPREIESLMSWFTSFYQFGMPLTEEVILEYELLYRAMKQRQIDTRNEMQLLKALTTGNFNLDIFKFRTQFFKKEDYQIFLNTNASFENASIRALRINVLAKLHQLRDIILRELTILKLSIENTGISTIELSDHHNRKINSMWISLSEKGVSKSEFINLQVGITPINISVRLSISAQSVFRNQRQNFHQQLEAEPFRKELYDKVMSLGTGYTIEVAGNKRSLDSFQQEQLLFEFFKADYGWHFEINIEKSFSPGDPVLSEEKIGATLAAEFSKLVSLYRLINSLE
jgi:hypothetical protein